MSWIRINRADVWIGVVAAVGVIGYVIAAELTHGIGFPLDDAWIHQTYARNLAQRGEWSFVPGEASVGSTSPLYTMVLAAGYVVHLPYFVWTFAVGILALAGAGWIGRRLGAILFPDFKQVGWWTGLALVTAWHLIWAAASGMETMWFSALSLAVVGLAWRERPDLRHSDRVDRAFWRGIALGFVGAALTLARPEGAAMLALTGLIVLVARPYGDWRLYAAWAGGVIAAWMIGIAPYLMWNYHVSGDLLPSTASAKQAEYAGFREQWTLPERYGRLLLPLLVSGLIMLLPGIVAGGYAIGQRVRRERHAILLLLPMIWVALHLSAYAIQLPAAYQHGRYVMPILPHLILYGVGGTFVILKAGRRKPLQRVLSRSLAASAALVTLGFWGIGAQQYGRDVRIINTEMVETAKWIKGNLPPDELLAVHDIGAVGYFAPRPIFDLAGLVSPEIVPVIRDDAARMQMMCERGAHYLMVFADQLPAEPDDPHLGTDWEYDPDLGRDGVKPIFQTSTPYAVEAGGSQMRVYRLNWPASCE